MSTRRPQIFARSPHAGDDNTYTTYQVASMIAVTPRTVINWVHRGALKCTHTPGGHRRIKPQDLVAFLEARDMAVPAALESKGVERILFVVPNPRSRGAIKTKMEAYTHWFHSSIIGDPLRALVEVGQKPPDLIVVDSDIRPNVRIFLQTIKAFRDTQSIAIGVLSKKPSPAFREGLMTAGATFCLPRPFRPEMILQHFGRSKSHS